MRSHAWHALGQHAASPPRLKELFAEEPDRGARLATGRSPRRGEWRPCALWPSPRSEVLR